LLQPFLDAKTIDIFSRRAYTEYIRIKFPIKRGKSMEMVLLTALGVGGATVFGSLIGFLFKNISHKFSDIVLSFAAGVMLAAAVLGLILPSLEYGGDFGILITIVGIFAGALCLNLIDKLVPHLHKLVGPDLEPHNNANLSKVLLFVTAIAIHNLPEGIAAGVSFGTGDNSQALLIAGGIALQNIPEGMVIIGPMLAAGVRPGRTFLCALVTGLIEVVGTLLGFFAVSIASAILPFALAFAGGTMLYVISDEMIPETHAHGSQQGATYALLVGFCLMLLSDVLLK
jgi:ZIP family zinc transporter